MNIVVAMTGIFTLPFGLLGVVAPEALCNLVDKMYKKLGIRFAIVSRLILGILFIIAAPECRSPEIIEVFGLFILVGAGLGFFIRQKGLDAFVAWWIKLNPLVVRTWSLTSASFALFIVYASGWPPIG